MIYLDNAATTIKKPPQVAEAMIQALNCAGNSARGTYESSLNAARLVYAAREKLAGLFGCPRPDHVAFAANVTEALNAAINGLISAGDHVISTDLEHNSVLRPLHRLQDVTVDFLPTDTLGNPVCDALSTLLHPRTRAIVCTHASNLTGNIVDIQRMADFAHEHGLLLIVDAAQTGGTLPVDMEKNGIDVVCFTGHKGLMGPQGTGGLCVREGLEIRPWNVGGSGVQSFNPEQPAQMPVRLEAGTLNTPGIAGLSAAVDFVQSVGIETIYCKENKLMNRFLDGIRDIPGLRLYGDFRGVRVPIVALNLDDRDSGEIADILSTEYNIAVRSGAHCAPRMHRALGTENQGAVRFSFSWYNTEDEIDAAVHALKEIAE